MITILIKSPQEVINITLETINFDMTMRKKFNHLISCLTICILMGCSTARHFDYGVGVKNKGSQMILVDPFQITDGTVSLVQVGEVHPNGTAGMSPFYTQPFQTVTVTWHISTTGVIGRAHVPLNLPKEFTKEMGREIDFYIYPEEQRVEVAYDILDPKTGQENIIR